MLTWQVGRSVSGLTCQLPGSVLSTRATLKTTPGAMSTCSSEGPQATGEGDGRAAVASSRSGRAVQLGFGAPLRSGESPWVLYGRTSSSSGKAERKAMDAPRCIKVSVRSLKRSDECESE